MGAGVQVEPFGFRILSLARLLPLSLAFTANNLSACPKYFAFDVDYLPATPW